MILRLWKESPVPRRLDTGVACKADRCRSPCRQPTIDSCATGLTEASLRFGIGPRCSPVFWRIVRVRGIRVSIHHQRIGLALDLLSEGLFPFFEQEMRAIYGDRWEDVARGSCRSQASTQLATFHWDAQAILTVMWDAWNSVFRKNLGIVERSIVSELREFRNRWAHQSSFSEDDTYRVLDDVQRLLIACNAAKVAAQVEEHKIDVLRDKLGRRVNAELARIRFNRARIVDVSLYTVCALAITSMVIAMWGDRHPMPAGFLAGFVLFVFSYFIYKRFQATPPVYGVHECSKCRKVIYSENCPYCDPMPAAEREWPAKVYADTPPQRRTDHQEDDESFARII